MTINNHLVRAERYIIKYMIDKGHNFSDISIAIKIDSTTISKKINILKIMIMNLI